jgi:serine/threonine protein kinase
VSRRAARFELGAVIADRRIDSVAGEGGMGIVYRAWNLRLKRIEAVKVIGEEFVRDKSFRERFERETEIAASIEHPHVVTLYDSGEGPSGELFIAMRYVEGTTLERLVRQRGKLDPRLAAELISQVSEALDAAHAQGLVHRDVKPANILIAENDAKYHAYLTDFGLAKRVSSQSALTGVGLMVGTVDYMAPEQAGAQAVDLHADIYALGATLYTALTGEVPYPREGDMARLLAKLSEPPPRVSEITSGVPPAFDEVVARAMAETPTDRYPSAGELGTAALDATGRRTSYSSRERRLRAGTSEPIRVGSVIDERYVIEAEAGSGGMAVVYRATHLKLSKTVALKMMSAALAGDPEFRRRFEDEARSASEIDHDHVIPVYDFGEDEHGLYIVMRYVDQNLRDLLRERGKFDPVLAVQIIEQVAAALDAAHARGLLHRDIKPANILIDESASRVFLADFGLVRASHDEDREDTQSKVLGTEWYMAPERRHREETKLGDIYSLGCVLWETLVGGTSPLPGRSAHGDDTEVPAGLRIVVERAVSERPRERFQSAGDLARAARDALVRLTPPTQVLGSESLVFQDPLSAGLSARVLKLCTETLAQTSLPAAREDLETIRRRLSEPLALAVAGRAGAGKSTLVNALVGRRIAGGGHGSIVNWFRGGTPERLELVLTSGERRVQDLGPDGEIPESLGVSPEEIAMIEVWLSTSSLKSLTIVDTPGLDITRSPVEERPSAQGSTEEVTALHRSDALLFAMAGDAMGADREALEAFRRRFEGAGRASAVNAIGVLTKADLVDPDGVSWRPAVERSARLREALGSLVTTVVPVATRIAQTANLGELSDEDVVQLSRWAELNPTSREQLLAGLGDNGSSVTSISGEDRERLLAILGRYGVRLALELADSGDPFNQVTLVRRLRELSGVDELRKQIDGLQLRGDALKADAALTELESLSWRYQLAALRDEIDRIRLDAPVLELVRLFDECAAGDIELGEGKLEELEHLLTGRTLADRLGLGSDTSQNQVRAVATQRAREWKTWAIGGLASFQGQQVANKVDDVYMQIAFPD